MLRAEHITKQYSLPDSGHTVFDAVSDVSLELKDGCVSSLVGESGSGKSTLARVLSYIEMPDIGKVFLGDLEVTSCKRKEIRSVRGKVQLVMQNALGSLDPHQSVAAILEEPLQLLFHMKAQDRRCRCLELMDMVRLERSTFLIGLTSFPAVNRKDCVLHGLWQPVLNILFLMNLSVDWMSL